MTAKNTCTIEVGGKAVEVPLATCRRIRSLIEGGDKITAIAIVRKLARVELKAAKEAIENPVNFQEPGKASKGGSGAEGFFDALKPLLGGQSSARRWIATHRVHSAGFGAALLVLAATSAFLFAGGNPAYGRHAKTWYYDLAGGKLFDAMYNGSPAAGIDGRADGAVRAFVFACDSCRSGSFVGFLEKFEPEAAALQQRLQSGEEVPDESAMLKTLTTGHKVRGPEQDKWVAFDSPEGRTLRNEIASKCGGKRPKACLP